MTKNEYIKEFRKIKNYVETQTSLVETFFQAGMCTPEYKEKHLEELRQWGANKAADLTMFYQNQDVIAKESI